MQIAILTFDGFNELDSFIAAGILNRLKPKGWKAYITSPTPIVTSMNGVAIHTERDLEFAASADAVIIGSGVKTREIAQDAELLSRIRLNPAKQLMRQFDEGSQRIFEPRAECQVTRARLSLADVDDNRQP